MDKWILVPLDGSARAERAVPLAERIARYSGNHVMLLQVVSRPAPLSGAYVPQLPSVEWIQQDVAAAKEYLTHVAQWPSLDGMTIETRVEIGAPAEVILEVAEAQDADLIVICGHGRTGPSRWVLGSVAEHVLRRAPMPVLVLREHGSVPDGPLAEPWHPLHALVALDGSSFAEAAIEPAANLMLALAGLGQAAIHLVVVLPPAEASFDTVPESDALRSVRVYLTRVADRLRAICPRLEVGWSIVPGGDPARALQLVAETGGPSGKGGGAGGYSLIAMATHGRSGVSRVAFGSVTEHVLHRTRLPLLVVRPRPASAAKPVHAAGQPHGSVERAEQMHVTASESESLWTPLF